MTVPSLCSPPHHTHQFISFLCPFLRAGGGGGGPAGPGSAHLGETSDGAPGAWEQRAPSSPDPWLCTQIAAPPPSPGLATDHQFPAGGSRESLSGPPRLPSTARAGTVIGSTGVWGGCSSPPTIWVPSRATVLGALEAVCTSGLVPGRGVTPLLSAGPGPTLRRTIVAPACWAPAPQWTPKPPRLAPRLAREVTEGHKGTASWGGFRPATNTPIAD